jgi:hypothetical protein
MPHEMIQAQTESVAGSVLESFPEITGAANFMGGGIRDFILDGLSLVRKYCRSEGA